MCEAIFVLSLGILALYVLPRYIVTSLPTASIFGISEIVAMGALLSLFDSVAAYFIPLKKESYIPTLVLFLLFSFTSAGVIVTTGGTGSPFVALWLLVAFFSAVFGVWGTLPLVFGVGVFLAYKYLHADFGADTVTITVFSGLLPIVAGLIVWWKSDKGGEGDTNSRDLKHLASELSEVASTSEVVINAIGDGVVAIDAQGLIQLINPAAQNLLGWNKRDAMNLSYRSVLHLIDQKDGKDIDAGRDPIQQALNTNQQVRTNHFAVVTKNGKKLIVSLVISPIGQMGAGVIAVFRDITNETAEQREQAEFISTASHEMRTPVASIEGYLGLALNPQTAQIDDKARAFIMKAHEGAQHLGRLFQDLLDVSKVDDQRIADNPQVIDLTTFTHDIVKGLTQKAVEKGLTLIYTPMPDDDRRHVAPVYYVNVDNDHIREILENLIENAIKYTPSGQVVVDITGDNDSATVSIKDSGVGIPAEDIPHLFQKFYRVDTPETRQIGGTGLGLYLCRKLTEAMGGRLWLESQYQKGSTFFVELPRIDADTATRLKAEQQRAVNQLAAKAAAPSPTFIPDMSGTPVATVGATPSSSAGGASPVASAATQPPIVKPATTVPRGESLTKEQIAAHVAQLEALARAQREAGGTPTPMSATPTPQPISARQSGTQVAPAHLATRTAPVFQDIVRPPAPAVKPSQRR